MGAIAAPEQIGQYAIDSELGRGSFGTVYRAHHVDRPDIPVALKIIEGRGQIDRMMLEPALLSRLNHPCIVGIEDYFQDGDRLALVLEFIEGEDLKSLLDRGETFSQDQIRELLVQMAGALAAAHGRSVVHRDIKPSNILVRRDGNLLRFVLTDFGIGQQVEGIQVRKHTGGTYLFMAPEQLRGRPGPQSDLWALGVVAYRMLTGRMPFPGPSLPDLAHQIMYANPDPPSKAGDATIDAELEAAVLRLLDKSLHERTASAEELLRQLDYRGRPQDVLVRTTIRKSAPVVGETIEKKLSRSIWWRKFWLVIILTIYFLPTGIVTSACLLAAGWLFFKGQIDDRWRLRKRLLVLAVAFGLFGVYSASRHIFPESNLWKAAITRTQTLNAANTSPPDNKDASEPKATRVQPGKKDSDDLVRLFGPRFGGFLAMFTGVAAIFIFFAPAIAASIYVRLRRLQREKVLRDAALAGGAGSDAYLELLRNALEYRFADVGFHQKYAEALFARGRIAEAAVEARLMLVQDHYNFSGNLLLANAYYALGLLPDCITVCDRYLTVSGYCFEFAELREQCQRRIGR